ncbi:aldo/keto reductase [Texcoconibacillus texcoconensis]|uniref:Aryl-alcohol dehydrogenase-like predicted oxidoreductase n=1 Tax=Texcoconibacillus texcoconensis TaxID=1095777 RepID=A0A840QNP3_9BACI|nr:aldo/keto reductase [Texcoconibacillus texcoconensis]MBB5172995.1 aryl-alcohol dehydrogenase-like predicted oxidoreductase [Texcoconibacillus texcoconensis]
MRKNQLGHSNLYISEIGYGCMSLGDNQRDNEYILHEAIEKGVNFFDTADLYDFGLNEQSVGKALNTKRDEVILATKGGNEFGEGIDGWRWNPSKSHIKNACKKSLQRLNTDYLDLYQLHGGTIDDSIDETIEAFEELVQEGLIRYYGLSSIRPNVIKTYLEKSNIVSVMMQYSLLDRRPEEWFDPIRDHNVSIIARGPVAKGLLTDRYESKLTEKGYLSYTQQELLEALPQLQDVANECGMPLNELALRYVLDQDIVATAIPGASHTKQLEANVEASRKQPLREETLNKLANLTKKDVYQQHR